jgi:hypothetical protein
MSGPSCGRCRVPAHPDGNADARDGAAGQDRPRDLISDEDAAHNRIDKVMRDLVKIANQLTFQNDALALAAIASPVTKTTAAHATWDGTTGADPFQDVLLAGASIEEENQGYNVDTVATTPTKFAYAISSAVAAGILPREAAATRSRTTSTRSASPTDVGQDHEHARRRDGDRARLAMLGSMAYERLGGGYQGDPSDMASGVESKRFREEGVDGVKVQARIVRAPMVQEPNSARIVTGA